MEGEPISAGRTVDLDEDGYLVTKLPDGKEVLVFREGLNCSGYRIRCYKVEQREEQIFLCILPGEQED